MGLTIWMYPSLPKVNANRLKRLPRNHTVWKPIIKTKKTFYFKAQDFTFNLNEF